MRNSATTAAADARKKLNAAEKERAAAQAYVERVLDADDGTPEQYASAKDAARAAADRAEFYQIRAERLEAAEQSNSKQQATPKGAGAISFPGLG